MAETIIQIIGLIATVGTVVGFFYKIDKRFGKIENNFYRLEKRLDNIELEAKRNSLLYLINLLPDNTVAIMRAYDEYKALGGNSYIDDIFYKWKAEYTKK